MHGGRKDFVSTALEQLRLWILSGRPASICCKAQSSKKKQLEILCTYIKHWVFFKNGLIVCALHVRLYTSYLLYLQRPEEGVRWLKLVINQGIKPQSYGGAAA